MTTGEKIRDLRTKANLSQEEFGGRVGVSRQTVTKWETDEGMPDADHLKLIASLFNISIDDLLDYKKELLSEFLYEEKYCLDGVKRVKPARSKEEQYALNRFKNAIHVTAIQKKKKWSWKKLFFWFLVEPVYSSQMEDIIENGIYTLLLVEEKEKSYFVTMKKGSETV